MNSLCQPLVLRSFRCFKCTNRDRLERTAPEGGMRPLPDDIVQIPEAIVSLTGSDRSPYPILVSMESGALRAFVYGEALIKKTSTRQNHNKGFPRYKGPKLGAKQDWYLLDKKLLTKLRENPGELNAPSTGAKAAVRLEELDQNIQGNLQKISEYFYRSRAEFDIPSDKETIKRAVKDMLWKMRDIGGEEEVHSLIRECAMEHFMSLQQESRSLASKAISLDMEQVMELAEVAFGLTPEEAAQFAHNQANGVRMNLSFRLVMRRPASINYKFLLPDGKPWDFYLRSRNSSYTHMSTLQRIVFMGQYMKKENADTFMKGFNAEEKDILGCTLPFANSDGSIDALKFLEFGFYATTMHVACVPCRKTREAICGEAKGSLVKALKAYAIHFDKVMLHKIDALDLAWERFFEQAKETFHLVQQSSSDNKDLPDAWEMLVILYELDTAEEKCPVTLLLRAFIGIAFFCGLRAEEIGEVRTTTFKPSNTRGTLTLERSDKKEGILIMRATHNKNMVNGLKTVEFPPWLSAWVLEYETDGRPKLGNPTHSGLFVTKTGQPVTPSKILLGNKSKRTLNDDIITLLRNMFPGRIAEMTCFTDLRGIFFQTNSVHITGSMLNIFANAREFVVDKKRKVCNEFLRDLDLPEAEDLKRGMAKLNASSLQQAENHYNNKTLHSIEYTISWYNAAKEFAWHVLSSNQAIENDMISKYEQVD